MKKYINRIILASTIWCFVGLAQADLSGDWEGVLDANGTLVPLVIHLQETDGQQTGSMDSPAQGAMSMPMTKLDYDAKNLTFELAAQGIHFDGQWDADSGTITGNFIQGRVYQMSFKRVDTSPKEHSKTSDPNDLLGQWGGVIEIPGNPLRFVMHVKLKDDALMASADSPDQGVEGMVIDRISLDEGAVVFTMKNLGVEFKGLLSTDQQTISGDFNQGGLVFKLELRRGDTPQALYERPQEPQPPYAYHVEEVVVNNAAAGIKLAGTLTRPNEGEPVKAAAVMITGSGAQDRDENIFNHKPFLAIADHLTQQGYAVLRLDDRGVGGSTGDFSQATTVDFVTDISAAVDYLKQRDDIPANKVGLIGHSEGGMVAPMLAAQRDDLAFIISLAGPGVPIIELLAEQKYLIGKVMGHDTAMLATQKQKDLQFHAKLAKLNQEPAYTQVVKAYFAASLKEQFTDEVRLSEQVESNVKVYDTPWFRFFIGYEPGPYLAQVKVPVLALNGEKDVQVEAQSNLAGIQASLQQAGHEDFTIRALPDLNHLFQTAQTGAVNEYNQISETFSPVALNVMSEWLNLRF